LILQGLHPSCKNSAENYVNKTMENARAETNLEIQKNQILIKVVSINAAGIVPPEYRSILPLFQDTKSRAMPDIVVLGI